MLNKLIPYSAKQFLHRSEVKTLSIEISELGGFSQLYDDAADQGIAVQGRTGTTYWHVADVKQDAEGDVLWWTLRPIPLSCRQHPAAKDYKMLVYND